MQPSLPGISVSPRDCSLIALCPPPPRQSLFRYLIQQQYHEIIISKILNVTLLIDLEGGLRRETCHHVALGLHSHIQLSLSLSLTHTCTRTAVSSPLWHMKDTATLWVLDDAPIQTHTTLSCQSSTEEVGCCGGVLSTYPTCFFAYRMCQSVCLKVCVSCLCLSFYTMSVCRTCHLFYQPGGTKHGWCTFGYVHTRNPVYRLSCSVFHIYLAVGF